MNRIYRLVFNRQLGVVQVACEFAGNRNARSAKGGGRRRLHPLSSALSFAVLAGATLGTAASLQAQAIINDAQVIDDDATFARGVNIGTTGTGSLVVRDGAQVTSSGYVQLGTEADGKGTLTVEGAGTRFLINANSRLYVGHAGTGELNVVGGGAVDASTNFTRLAGLAGSKGTLTVSGDRSYFTTLRLDVGALGDGTLNVLDGGKVTTTTAWSGTNTNGLGFGNEAGSTGVGTVSGAGSLLEVKGNHLAIGLRGNGTLNVSDGAQVVVERDLRVGSEVLFGHSHRVDGVLDISGGAHVSAGRVIISEDENAHGRVTVDGSNSVLEAGRIFVGSQAEGWLLVRNGGAVSGDRLVAEDADRAGSDDFDQAGRVQVTGGGSRIEMNSVTLSEHSVIEEQGQVISTTALIQDSHSKDRSVATIRGAGTLWTNSGRFDTRTNVDLLDGARIETGSAHISGGGDTVDFHHLAKIEQMRVRGNGARLHASQGLTVGSSVFDGWGFLTLGEGGSVAAEGDGLDLTSAGYVAFGGGLTSWETGMGGGPVFAAAENAGAMDPATVIRMRPASGGLVFNHLSDGYGFSNRIISTATSTTHDAGSFNGGSLHNVAGTTVVSGDLSGYGGNIRVTGGKLVIESDMYTARPATSTYAGALLDQQLQVTGGMLIVNGTSGFLQEKDHGGAPVQERASMATVSGSGILGGVGVLGTLAVLQGGTLSPGDGGVGTLTVDGDLYLNHGTLLSPDRKVFYDVDILADGRSDLLKVSGAARIGSAGGSANLTGVRVSTLDAHTSYQDGKAYVIVQAAEGVHGTFDEVTSRSAFITPTLSYTDKAVILNIGVVSTPSPPVPPPVTPPPPTPPVTSPGAPPAAPGTPNAPLVFGRVAQTANQASVAGALDTLLQAGDALALYNNLLMHSAEEARLAFNFLAGDVYPGNRALLLEDRFLRDAIGRTLRDEDRKDGAGALDAWVAVGGNRATLDSDGNAGQARLNGFGVAAGLGWQVSDGWNLGAAIGHQDATLSARQRTARTDVDARYAGLYADGAVGAAYVRSGVIYADYGLAARRSVHTANAPMQALNANSAATAITFFAEAGFHVEFDSGRLTPYLNLNHTRLENDAFTEMGGAAALVVAAQKDEWWTATAGARAIWDISGGAGDGAALSFGLAWQHGGGDELLHSRHRLIAGSDAFQVQGVPMARNVGLADLSIAVNTSQRSRLQFTAEARAGDGLSDVGGYVNWHVRF